MPSRELLAKDIPAYIAALENENKELSALLERAAATLQDLSWRGALSLNQSYEASVLAAKIRRMTKESKNDAGS